MVGVILKGQLGKGYGIWRGQERVASREGEDKEVEERWRKGGGKVEGSGQVANAMTRTRSCMRLGGILLGTFLIQESRVATEVEECQAHAKPLRGRRGLSASPQPASAALPVNLSDINDINDINRLANGIVIQQVNNASKNSEASLAPTNAKDAPSTSSTLRIVYVHDAFFFPDGEEEKKGALSTQSIVKTRG
jgi:hypothetical protein